MKDSTRVNHPPPADLPAGNRPLVAPLYQSVKFEFASTAETQRMLRGEREGYYYQRGGNPTVRQLERTLAALQQRDDCIACASGVAATAGVLLSLTRAGDHVLCFYDMYGPTRHQVRQWLGRYGVRSTVLSVEDRAAIEQTLASTPTRLVVFETPTNPVMRIVDLEWLTALARRHGALTVLDNTLAGPHQQGQFPVDIFVHSLTKYVSGHGDAMGGAVIARSELIREMRSEFSELGATLDPHAAFLLQRGLKTLPMRYRQHTDSALRIARHLQRHPAVAAVHHAGLDDHPAHALAMRQAPQAGGVLSLELRDGAEAAVRFADQLTLFGLAASFGAGDSLVQPPPLLLPRDLSEAERLRAGLAPSTTRLAIGLEDPEDLIADIDQALAAAGA